jgi:hypothetical protein
MTQVLRHLLANWKSSVIGLCVCVLAVTRSLQYDVAGHLMMTARDWVGVVAGVVAAVMGMLMTDAGQTLVHVPGGGVALEASHEVPDNGATPVKR